MKRYPLLPITAAFAAGIGAAPHFYLTASEQLWLLTLVVVGAALLLWMRRESYATLACWLGFFLCGTFFAAAEHSYFPANHLERLVRQQLLRPAEPAEFTGWARSLSERRPGNETFDLEVEQIHQAGQTRPATGGIRVYYFPNQDDPPSLEILYGTRLRVSLQDLRRPRNFLTADSFDWEAYMRRQGISFTGRVRIPQDFEVLPGRAGNWWLARIYSLRGQLLANLDRLYAGNSGLTDHGAILKAMLLGDDNWLSPQVESEFQASGTYHVLVVSGWNVFAFAIPLLWLVARLRLPEWLGTVLVAIAVIGFALLAEGGPSVSRAALMFLIYLLACHFYRERAALNSIAAAALVLLLIHPSDLRDAGFQLSFFAVMVLAGIAVPLIAWIAAPYRNALRNPDDRSRDLLLQPKQIQFRNDFRVLLDVICGPPRKDPSARNWFRAALGWSGYGCLWLAEGLVFTALIQVGLFLVMLQYFHRLTWSGVFANLVVLPMASGIVLIGLPLLFLSLLWWQAAVWGTVVLDWVTAALEGIVEYSAGWELLNGRGPAPPLWLTLIFFALLLVMAVLVARRSRWTWAAAVLLAVCCLILSRAPYPAQLSPGRLEVAVLDVGQGDSIFVSFPNGATMLVDGGGAIPIPGSPPPRLDIGESVISSYLWSRNIQKLDTVVLTHDHWDHMGGLAAVLKNFRVGELWMGQDPEDREVEMDRLRAVAASRGTRYVEVREGLRRVIGGVDLQVLSPPVDWTPRRVSNNDSVVLRLGYKGRHILLPGDVEERMERRLLAAGEPLASDVLKVAHHGSRTSSTAEFLRRVAPQFGIISVGAFKRFNHPNDEVIEALRAAGVRTYRTDRDGTTTVSTDGHRIEVTTYREALRPWPQFVP
ncbi:MAG: ComEC/Rec2 family competence protein [Acidobacteria bacterium]|nr:ComEC/Rec2 family competence protein [Acidobacteriota bacterium]